MVKKDFYNGEAFLNKYIPSKDMRNKIAETEHAFSIWDASTIIWNSEYPLEEKYKDLQLILDCEPDDELREQITERIAYDKDVLRLFKEKKDGFIYVLDSHKYGPEECIEGYFKKYETTYKNGCMLENDFAISKYPVVNDDIVINTLKTILSIIESDEDGETDYSYPVSKVEFDKNGNILSYWSYEMPKDRSMKVETGNNKCFENRFVVFPKVFKGNEKVHCIGGNHEEFFGWVRDFDYDSFIKSATSENAKDDFIDTTLPIDYWDENRLIWNHQHLLSMDLEWVTEELYNSYDENHQVIIGHDYGNSVWIQVIEVSVSETTEVVNATGKEISVNKDFFDRVFKKLFVQNFDSDMSENKRRYTYAFSNEGRYLSEFEENILEYNFFTYEQIEKIATTIEECVRDGALRIEECIGGTDAVQMVTFAAHLRRIMEGIGRFHQ